MQMTINESKHASSWKLFAMSWRKTTSFIFKERHNHGENELLCQNLGRDREEVVGEKSLNRKSMLKGKEMHTKLWKGIETF